MLAKTYHAVVQRRSAAGLCWTAITSIPGSILSPPFAEHGPPPAPTEVKDVSQGLQGLQ